MIDISELGIQFRGYPVTIASDDVMTLLSQSGHGVTGELATILRTARDIAEPGEPAGWTYEACTSDTVIWIERFGGTRTADHHEGGQWSVHLPGE